MFKAAIHILMKARLTQLMSLLSNKILRRPLRLCTLQMSQQQFQTPLLQLQALPFQEQKAVQSAMSKSPTLLMPIQMEH